MSARVRRNLKPRADLGVVPVTITQHTALPVIGFGDRRYLDEVQRHPEELRPVKLGQLVVTRVDAWERLFAKLSAAGEPLPSNDGAPNDAPIETEADVWAALGRGSR